MTVPVLGALFGLGVVAFLYGMRPERARLSDVLTGLNTPTRPEPAPTAADDPGWATRLGRIGVPLVRALGFPTQTLRNDLAVCGTPVDSHLAGKTTCAVAGLAAPWATTTLLTLAGSSTGWWTPLAASLLLAVTLFFAPDMAVRRKAAERRREMRHTLALVLDLTVIALAGGAGIQQALGQATSAPGGWAAGKLRHTLHVAELTRTSPWEQLAELGRQLDVPDLRELASTLDLAGSEGAKVRASLGAKARAMRRRRITEADGAAQAATERMSLPLALLFAAFLLLIGYPALAHVLAAT